MLWLCIIFLASHKNQTFTARNLLLEGSCRSTSRLIKVNSNWVTKAPGSFPWWITPTCRTWNFQFTVHFKHIIPVNGIFSMLLENSSGVTGVGANFREWKGSSERLDAQLQQSGSHSRPAHSRIRNHKNAYFTFRYVMDRTRNSEDKKSGNDEIDRRTSAGFSFSQAVSKLTFLATIWHLTARFNTHSNKVWLPPGKRLCVNIMVSKKK